MVFSGFHSIDMETGQVHDICLPKQVMCECVCCVLCVCVRVCVCVCVVRVPVCACACVCVYICMCVLCVCVHYMLQLMTSASPHMKSTLLFILYPKANRIPGLGCSTYYLKFRVAQHLLCCQQRRNALLLVTGYHIRAVKFRGFKFLWFGKLRRHGLIYCVTVYV